MPKRVIKGTKSAPRSVGAAKSSTGAPVLVVDSPTPTKEGKSLSRPTPTPDPRGFGRRPLFAELGKHSDSDDDSIASFDDEGSFLASPKNRKKTARFLLDVLGNTSADGDADKRVTQAKSQSSLMTSSAPSVPGLPFTRGNSRSFGFGLQHLQERFFLLYSVLGRLDVKNSLCQKDQFNDGERIFSL
jgi:hypothetical protein